MLNEQKSVSDYCEFMQALRQIQDLCPRPESGGSELPFFHGIHYLTL